MTTPPKFLMVAQITTTVGVQGEVKVRPETDDPLRLKGVKSIEAVLANGTTEVLAIEAIRMRKDGIVIGKFGGYDSPEAAAKLRQAWLRIPFEDAKRVPGKVLYADVLGLTAVDDMTGETLGTVREVFRAAQDLLEVITPDGREVLVPWVDVFVAKIDLAARQVRLTPPSGLFDEDTA